MGIQNLLRFMKPFIHPVHIKKYAGKRVGIDAYSWLHKGAYSCSLEICQNSDSNKKSRYLDYFMHRIELLRHHKITPVVVFDGGHLPCKSATEGERSKRRETNLALAREQLTQGNLSAAIDFFQRAVSITPAMAHQLIQILKSENVEFVVAPYEADAQLAYLANLEEEHGGIAAVITEDSDLMAYGCEAIVFKMDRFGNGEEILMDKVFNSAVYVKEKNDMAAVPSFHNFDRELFTGMCVLAGCDFLDSISGIGIKRAHSLVAKYKNLDRVLAVLKIDKGRQMPEGYSKSFREAVAVFHHARIFDAITKTIKPMKPLPQMLMQSLEGELDFLGPEIPSSVAISIAEGRLDPISMEAFDHFSKANSHIFDRFSRTETCAVSRIESSFTLFTSQQTKEDKMTVEEQKPFPDKTKYLKESFALQKLIEPGELHLKFDNDVMEIRNFPNNDPFKKRKIQQVCLDQEDSVSQQVSVISNVSESDDDIVERRDFPDNNPFKKKKCQDVCLDQEDSISQQVSVITSVIKSDEMLCVTPESQESVTSKHTKKIEALKVVKRIDRKLKKTTACETPARRKGSILNFFNRL